MQSALMKVLVHLTNLTHAMPVKYTNASVKIAGFGRFRPLRFYDVSWIAWPAQLQIGAEIMGPATRR